MKNQKKFQRVIMPKQEYQHINHRKLVSNSSQSTYQ